MGFNIKDFYLNNEYPVRPADLLDFLNSLDTAALKAWYFLSHDLVDAFNAYLSPDKPRHLPGIGYQYSVFGKRENLTFHYFLLTYYYVISSFDFPKGDNGLVSYRPPDNPTRIIFLGLYHDE